MTVPPPLTDEQRLRELLYKITGARAQMIPWDATQDAAALTRVLARLTYLEGVGERLRGALERIVRCEPVPRGIALAALEDQVPEGEGTMRGHRLATLIAAAERVCSEAEAYEDQWKGGDYDLYPPLREAIDNARKDT